MDPIRRSMLFSHNFKSHDTEGPKPAQEMRAFQGRPEEADSIKGLLRFGFSLDACGG